MASPTSKQSPTKEKQEQRFNADVKADSKADAKAAPPPSLQRKYLVSEFNESTALQEAVCIADKLKPYAHGTFGSNLNFFFQFGKKKSIMHFEVRNAYSRWGISRKLDENTNKLGDFQLSLSLDDNPELARFSDLFHVALCKAFLKNSKLSQEIWGERNDKFWEEENFVSSGNVKSLRREPKTKEARELYGDSFRVTIKKMDNLYMALPNGNCPSKPSPLSEFITEKENGECSGVEGYYSFYMTIMSAHVGTLQTVHPRCQLADGGLFCRPIVRNSGPCFSGVVVEEKSPLPDSIPASESEAASAVALAVALEPSSSSLAKEGKDEKEGKEEDQEEPGSVPVANANVSSSSSSSSNSEGRSGDCVPPSSPVSNDEVPDADSESSEFVAKRPRISSKDDINDCSNDNSNDNGNDSSNDNGNDC